MSEDRLVALLGGLLGGAVALVAIWLIWQFAPAQMARAARTRAGWRNAVGAHPIMAQNGPQGVDQC